MLSPENVMLLGIAQVLLWTTVNLIKKKWPALVQAMDSLKELSLFMIPIYAVPELLHKWNLPLVLFFIPYTIVSASWFVRWYNHNCNSVDEKKWLQKTVKQAGYSLTGIGILVLVYLVLTGQLVQVYNTMTEDFPLNILGSIAGGAISGIVGLFIVWYTNRGRNKRWLRENVFRQLYNEISDLKERGYYSRFFRFGSWNDVDRYSKFKIESKLVELLDNYSREITKYQLIIRKKIDDFVDQKGVLEPILKIPFQKYNLIDNNGNIIRHRNSPNSPLDWLIDYSSVFFNSKITDSKTLYSMLEERASKANDGYLDSIQKWKDEKPDLYPSIFEQLSELKKNFHATYGEEDLEKQRQVLVKLTDELVMELKKKLK